MGRTKVNTNYFNAIKFVLRNHNRVLLTHVMDAFELSEETVRGIYRDLGMEPLTLPEDATMMPRIPSDKHRKKVILKPYDDSHVKIQRHPAVYSNSSPYGLADELRKKENTKK